MTDVSLNFRSAAYPQESGVFPICLITIAHADWPAAVRLSSDPTERLVETVSDIVYGTQSNGNDYYFFPASLKLPDDTDDGPGRMELRFANVTRDYVSQIRSISGRPTVDVSIVMSNAVNTVEVNWPQFYIVDASYDAGEIALAMEMETLEREPYPYATYNPAWFPGLFRGL